MRPLPDTPKYMLPVKWYVMDAFRTGSRTICGPKGADDCDIAVLTHNFNLAKQQLNLRGYRGGDTYPFDFLYSMRKGNIHILLMTDRHYFEKWRLATGAAKALGLSSKNDRRTLFEHITEDERNLGFVL